MIVGRINKDSAEIRRITVDFAADQAGSWLDPGEVIGSFSTPVIVVQQLAVWNCGVPMLGVAALPADTTPLQLINSAISTDGTQVGFLIGSGTPGLTYKFTFVAAGSLSGRTKQIDIIVTVREPA